MVGGHRTPNVFHDPSPVSRRPYPLLGSVTGPTHHYGIWPSPLLALEPQCLSTMDSNSSISD